MQEEIRRLKEERRAILLAHNYQAPEIQDVADYIGDSLGLSREAAKTDAEVICFCGVNFMGETAKILNPERIVVLPDTSAGCSLEECAPAAELLKFKTAYPELYVVSYINCSSSVKALSDVICTSGNAVRIVSNCPKDRPILFTPDQNLGSWVAKQTGREMILWPGCCYAHALFTADAVVQAKKEHPWAKVVTHPECLQEVKDVSDEVCSTEKMISYCRENSAREFIIATEANMIYRLQKECPDKLFFPLKINGYLPECRHMKKITLSKLLDTLRTLQPQIHLSKEIMDQARASIERMLEWS
ncbi:MAG: quinolinate synthase NadA [Verrucomicrobia bacterium]|nr:quinolinate synthase NadA [Verrucomicrobiota bacterium]